MHYPLDRALPTPHARAANRIESVVRGVVLEGRNLPADLAPGCDAAKPHEVADALLCYLAANA